MRRFARYMNRGQTTKTNMKDNLGVYEYQPELISALEPAPAFAEKALGLTDEQKKRKRDSLHNLERYRTAEFTKRMNVKSF